VNISVIDLIAGHLNNCELSHIILPVNLLCVLNTIPEEKLCNVDVLEPDHSEEYFGGKKSTCVLSRLIPHFIDPQPLGKAVQCNLNVNMHNRLTGEVISHSQRPTIRAKMLIFA
jgi:hypothetical protein